MSNPYQPGGPGSPNQPPQNPAGAAPSQSPPNGPSGYGPPGAWGPGQQQGYGGPPAGWGPPGGAGPYGGPAYGPPPGAGFGAPRPYGQPWGQPFGGPGYYAARPPQPSSAPAVFAILGGVFGGLIAFVLWLAQAYAGYVGSLFAGLFVAGTAWLLAFGITRLVKKPLPMKVQLGAVALVTLVLGAAGPAVSRSYHVSSEASLYEKLTKPGTNSYEWDRYASEVPKEFQRKGWQNEKFVAKVREAKGNAKQLHDVLKAITSDKDADKLDGAKNAAEKELASLYDAGKARLYAPPRSGSAPEFPVDENLRGAFGGVLAELSDSPDPSIYVAFTSSSNLAPPPETDQALKLYRDDPGVRESFPKGDVPVIDAGDAFSPSFDQRRRTTFITAMSESFAKVFDSELISLVPLEKNASRDGKIVIEVSSKISRQADFFIYSAEVTPGVKRVKGLLFSIGVEWGFKIVDRDGKVVYQAPVTSSQAAERVRIQRGENDPQWALYSIMMDSAYYNYSREVAGRFGFEPAPVKDSFSYGAASTSATTDPSPDP